MKMKASRNETLQYGHAHIIRVRQHGQGVPDSSFPTKTLNSLPLPPADFSIFTPPLPQVPIPS